MKKIGRSILSLLLVVMILIPCLSIAVTAATGPSGSKYRIDLRESARSEDQYIVISGGSDKKMFNGFYVDDSTVPLTKTDDLTVFGDADHTDFSYVTAYRGDLVMHFCGLGTYGNALTDFPRSQTAWVDIDNRGDSHDLLFNYYLDDGKMNVEDATNCTINTATSSVIVRAGVTARIYFTTPMGSDKNMLFHIYNVRVVESVLSSWVTFNGAEHGTVQVGGVTLGDGDAYSEQVYFYEDEETEGGIELSCTAVEEGYEFIGFRDTDNTFIPAGKYYPSTNNTVSPLFVKTSDYAPLYGVEEKIFTDFSQAMTYASTTNSKRVIVLHDGVLTAGDYTIPSGVSLLVPFDDDHNMFTVTPGTVIADSVTTRTPYCTFELAAGVHLTVDGAISVSAKHPSTTASAKPRGAVGPTFGWMILNEGADITLNSGANLYAWGFITGGGNITAHSGATVYEYFQINDFRGGTITANMATDSSLNQFPFNQYYVQNIESHLRIEYGASEHVCMELYAASQVVTLDLEFIGSSDGMFVLEDEGTYLEKYYDAANDKMKYELGGSASISSITLSLAGITITSADYYLPINNIDFTLTEDSTLTTDKDIIFLPGSSVTIDEGATVNVADGGSVVIAAKDDVTNYRAVGSSLKNPCNPVIYTPTPHPTRTWSNTPETYVDNNGTIVVAENATLAATSPEAEIFSSEGTGVLQMDGTNDAAITLTKYIGSSTVNGQTVVNTDDVETVPAVVQDTQGASADGEGHSTTSVWGTPSVIRKDPVTGQYGDYREVTWIDLDESVVCHEDSLSYDAFLTYTGAPAPSDKPADASGAYITKGWKIGTVTTTAVTIVPDYELVPNQVTIYWMKEDGVTSAPIASNTYAYGATPKYTGKGRNAMTKTSDAQYSYTFYGWSDGTDEYDNNNMPAATKDTVYTVVFTPKLRSYSAYWLIEDPADPTNTANYVYLSGTSSNPSVTVSYGEQFEYPNAELPVLSDYFGDGYADYKFIGWKIGLQNGTSEFYPVGSELPLCQGSVTATKYICAACFAQTGPASGNAYFDSHTLSLDGSIGVNFYITLPDGQDAADYTLTYSFKNTTSDPIPLSDVYDDTFSRYKFTARVNSPEMTDNVIAVLYKDGEVVDISEFSVADYSVGLNAADDDVIEGNYYLVGTIGGDDCWTGNVQPKYKFVQNPNSNENEYMLQYVELHAGDEIKIVQKAETGFNYYPDTTWGNPTGNKTISADGTYTIYFRPNGNGSLGDPWFYQSFYVQEVKPLRKLVRAMLNYGGASQTYFADKEYAGVISSDNASTYIYDPEYYPGIDDDMIKDRIKAKNNNVIGTDLSQSNADLQTALSACGLEFYGVSSVLYANTSLRVYFKVKDLALYRSSISGITFGFNDESVTEDGCTRFENAVVDLDGDPTYVYLEYSDIAAANLDKTAVMKFNGTEIFHYSVFDYLLKARAQLSDDDNLMALVKALYYYNVTADEYFN